jgi:hypothetical protein
MYCNVLYSLLCIWGPVRRAHGVQMVNCCIEAVHRQYTDSEPCCTAFEYQQMLFVRFLARVRRCAIEGATPV